MAVRAPLKNNSGNLQQMTSAEVDAIIDQIVYQYSLSPSVVLSVVGSGGNLGTITDTRKQAGAMSTSTTSFPAESSTAEPSTVTINYDKITSTGHLHQLQQQTQEQHGLFMLLQVITLEQCL